MLYRKIIAVCSQIHTKHINTLSGQNVELLNVKLVVHIVTTRIATLKVFLALTHSKFHIPYNARGNTSGFSSRLSAGCQTHEVCTSALLVTNIFQYIRLPQS